MYVTGKSAGILTDKDYVTIKYASDGSQLWAMRYNGPGFGVDEACSLAVDAAGNVFVTGTSYGASTGQDYTTIKYDEYQPSVWAAAEQVEAAPVTHASSKTILFPNVLSFLLFPLATIVLIRAFLGSRHRGRRPAA